MIDTKHFLECLIHKWDNLHQAQCQPNQFAHVHYDWFVNDDGVLSSKQWYHWNGETYRERTHWLSQQEDKLQLLIIESDITLEFRESEAGVYVGKTEGQIDYNGVKVESVISLDSTTFTSMDKGTDANGKVQWGVVPSPFIFKHT
tara:strand:- start:25837 stop:26271 length:435 start_codon:yes stop_codon:yes gene_type:complete